MKTHSQVFRHAFNTISCCGVRKSKQSFTISRHIFKSVKHEVKEQIKTTTKLWDYSAIVCQGVSLHKQQSTTTQFFLVPYHRNFYHIKCNV